MLNMQIQHIIEEVMTEKEYTIGVNTINTPIGVTVPIGVNYV